MPRIDAWVRYTNEHPPLQRMVQGYLGIKPEKRNVATNLEDAMNFLRGFPGSSEGS